MVPHRRPCSATPSNSPATTIRMRVWPCTMLDYSPDLKSALCFGRMRIHKASTGHLPNCGTKRTVWVMEVFNSGGPIMDTRGQLLYVCSRTDFMRLKCGWCAKLRWCVHTFGKLAVPCLDLNGKWANEVIGIQPLHGNMVPAQKWKHYAWCIDAFRGSIWHFEDGQLQKYEPSLFQGSFLPWYALS